MADKTTPRKLVVEPFNESHDIKSFSCGNDYLDQYLRKINFKVRDQIGGTVHVLRYKDDPNKIIGYYSLAAYSVDISGLPDDLKKQLPRWNPASATMIGQFAIDRELQSHGYGRFLLIKALRKSLELSRDMASAGVVVDSISDEGTRLYKKVGFINIDENSKRMFLHMKTIDQLSLAPSSKK